MLRHRLIASAAILGLAATIAAPAAAANCLAGSEYRAAQVRQLQTEMMVTALKCNGHPTLPLTAQYNQFINRFGGELSRNAGVLRAKYPGAKLDKLVTTMANDASMRSLSVVGYCEEQAPMFEKVMDLKAESQLEQAAADLIGNRLPVSACREPATRSAAKPAPDKKVAAVKPKTDKPKVN